MKIEEIFKPAIDIIEKASKYALLPNEGLTTAIYIGNRKQLERVLKSVDANMIIATTGTKKHCIILIDLNPVELTNLILLRKNQT